MRDAGKSASADRASENLVEMVKSLTDNWFALAQKPRFSCRPNISCPVCPTAGTLK